MQLYSKPRLDVGCVDGRYILALNQICNVVTASSYFGDHHSVFIGSTFNLVAISF